LAQGLSPLLLADQPVDFDFELAANTVMPAPQQLQSSEFVEPLEEAAIANYNQLWQQLRGRE
jgi:putative spermidine/putrescine transport system substrate-binding protein